jgi:hypothetical protein
MRCLYGTNIRRRGGSWVSYAMLSGVTYCSESHATERYFLISFRFARWYT